MRISLFSGIALAFFSSVACAQTTSPQEFVNKAAGSNMFEIDSSKVALERAKSQEVKAFAQQMIDDHTKAGEELKQTVSKIGSGPVPETLDAEHKADLSALSNKSGADFDRAYSLAQRKAHDDAVTLFSGFADSGAQPDLKAFAAKTLPTLKDHLQQVQELSKTVGGKKPTS
jgi:putative membrane protein